MCQGLFDELPLVTSEAELKLLLTKNTPLDPDFIRYGCCPTNRSHFEALWLPFKQFADTNFCQQLGSPGQFHHRSWEMLCCNILLDKGINLLEGRKLTPPIPRNEGPDFIVNGGPYVECVSSTRGASTNRDQLGKPLVSTLDAPQFIQISGDTSHYARLSELGIEPPSTQIDENIETRLLLRITQSIKEKSDNYLNKWALKSWFDPNTPFVIAMNTCQLRYPDNPGMPYVLKALFGAGDMYLNFSPSSGAKEYCWEYRNAIQRNSGATIPVNLFMSSCLEHVSAIIFLHDTVLDYLIFGDRECIIVNNPFATNPLSDDFLSRFRGWKSRREGNSIFLTKT